MRLLLALLLMIPAISQANDDLDRIRRKAEHMLNVSAHIKAGDEHGTGIAVRRDGQTYILTNWHVVDSCRREKQVSGPDGTRTIATFADVTVIRFVISDGTQTGKRESAASLVAYSDDKTGYDLALLKVHDASLFSEGVNFYLDREVPFIGMPLYHVGSLNGDEAPISLTTGIVSAHGRKIGPRTFDQVTVTNFPGSSGGGVFCPDGRCVGLLTRRTGETLGYMNPVREIREWAEASGVGWILDPAAEREK